MSRAFTAKKLPPREFFREQRLRANRFQFPRTVEANGARFLIAGNGMRIPLNVAVEHQLPDAEIALKFEGRITPLS